MDIPNSTTTKRCTKCGEWKPRDQFSKDSSAQDGLQRSCKQCYADWRNQHSAERAQYDKNYRAANKEKLNARKKEYNQEHAEYRREYAQRHNESFPNIKKEYKERNRESIRKYHQDYRNAHTEQRRLYREQTSEHRKALNAEWRKRNPGKMRVYSHARRAREQSAGGTYTASDIESVRFAQTDGRGRLICAWCGKPITSSPHIDHWIPLKLGGSNTAGNLRYMHAKCNLTKGSKHPSEFGRLI